MLYYFINEYSDLHNLPSNNNLSKNTKKIQMT